MQKELELFLLKHAYLHPSTGLSLTFVRLRFAAHAAGGSMQQPPLKGKSHSQATTPTTKYNGVTEGTHQQLFSLYSFRLSAGMLRI